LPLGAVLFATTGGEAGPSLPSTVADGDLDGDLYLALWDKVGLPHRALSLSLSLLLSACLSPLYRAVGQGGPAFFFFCAVHSSSHTHACLFVGNSLFCTHTFLLHLIDRTW
jgi:hypothetical protein